jgi:DNA-binding NarL/FixJ family response regulator
MKIKLVIADDHEVVRTGLVNMFAGTEVEVAATAENADEAIRQTLKHKPDVVLLDIRMANGDGLTALAQIKSQRPETAVLILSTYDNPTYVARAVSLGASGYLLKGCTKQELLETIRKAAKGESAWSRAELRRVSGALSKRRAPSELDVTLTPRESEVLKLLAGGLSNQEIGDKLGISYETVKEHVQHVLRKLGVADRTQAAVWAVRKGMV